ncbi:MAG: HEAT repeat domain-containing protein [Proteobacteria bacterium]|nr:HEAT repeat domain-containing protein [Pseudomonadota bacterium]
MIDLEKIKSLIGNADEDLRIKGLKYLKESQNSSALELLTSALGDDSWRVRKTAVEIMTDYSDVESLLPYLLESLRCEDNAGMRNSSAEVLEILGRKSANYLVQFVDDEDHDLRKFVIDILGNIGDKIATPYLIKALSDDDENVKSSAAESLGKIGDDKAVNSLIDSLANNDLLLQFSALEALCKAGKGLPVSKIAIHLNNPLLKKAAYDVLGVSNDIEALPYLLKGLEDRSKGTRKAALKNLVTLFERMTVDKNEAKAMLEEKKTIISGVAASFLEKEDEETVAAAIKLLGWIKHKQSIKEILPWSSFETLAPLVTEVISDIGLDGQAELIDAYLKSDDVLRPYICSMLGEIGAQNAVDLLIEALRNDVGHIRHSSAISLGKLRDQRAIKPLMPLFEDDYGDVQEAAVIAFSYLAGEHRDAVLAVLKNYINSESFSIRRNCVKVLSNLGKKGDFSLALTALRDEEGSIRKNAVEALGALGGDEAVSPLILSLSDEERDVRIAGIECLGKMKCKESLKPLLTGLYDEDIWVKSAAIRAVASIGEGDVADQLTQLLNDGVGLIVIVALEALGKLALDETVPAMMNAMENEDNEVVKAAVENMSFSEDETYLTKLMSFIDHKNWEIRVAAIKVLSEKNVKGLKEMLSKRLDLEDDDLVISSINEALSNLT